MPEEDSRSHKLDTTARALISASLSARVAADAIDEWEKGGFPDPVTNTAAKAKHQAQIAIEAIVADEPWAEHLDDPPTRRGRLGYAGWLILLAGTDEDGRSADLFMAADLFVRAANS